MQVCRPAGTGAKEAMALSHASEGAPTLAELFPLGDATDAPLDAEVVGSAHASSLRGRIHLREMRFLSHEWSGGAVRIAAYLAVPPGRGPHPLLVDGTGTMDSARDFAKRHGVACLAFDRPGVGQSTGPEDQYQNWIHFDDPRESWMWHYVYAAMRAVTLARTLPEIDADRIGITGYSRGGTMAFILNGADPRLAVSVPQASAGDIVSALGHSGWANYLYRNEAGECAIPAAFREFARYYDPLAWAGLQKAPVMPILGAQDEYFPIATVGTTVAAMAGARLQLIPDWDHRYFTGDNPHVDAFDNSREAARRTRAWMQAAIDGLLRRRAPLPEMPTLRSEGSAFTVVPDPSLPAVGVRVWLSTDGAYTFGSRAVPCNRPMAERMVDTGLDTDTMARAVAFGEASYPRGLHLSSLPWFGPEFRQRMRPFPE